MSIERISIQPFLTGSGDALLLDVRSPSEFKHAHMPGALSIPLFTDEERSQVGTAYKQVSREAAIKIGLDFFGPRMRAIVEEVERLLQEKGTKQIYLYCWRGGMRSGAMSWLLDLYGFKVFLLQGGYKAFRTWVIQTYSFPYPFQLVGGYTGSGKTHILDALQQKGEVVVDLENLAKHKGSAFGNIGLPPQPTQEMFENLLALDLKAKFEKAQTLSKPIWLEDESQRIGTINLPSSFWNAMRDAPLYFLDIPFEERLQHLVQEYGSLDAEKMGDAIERISKRLGSLQTKNAISYLREGNIPESFRILLQYYDKHYLKALLNRQNLSTVFNKIQCSSVSETNIQYLLSKPMTA